MRKENHVLDDFEFRIDGSIMGDNQILGLIVVFGRNVIIERDEVRSRKDRPWDRSSHGRYDEHHDDRKEFDEMHRV